VRWSFCARKAKPKRWQRNSSEQLATSNWQLAKWAGESRPVVFAGGTPSKQSFTD
jgi:hypothetical protein